MTSGQLLSSNGIHKIIHFLFERGLVNNFTDIKKIEQVFKSKGAAYVGFDVTKPSLQIGNWMSINTARLLAKRGVKAYIVLGGGTTLVGDPSGKSEEREIASINETKNNIKQIKNYLGRKFPELIILDNAEWLSKLKAIDFLRICKGISVNYLLDRQLIKERLLTSGISTTELFYTLVQGYDFYYLRKSHDVRLQFGGSDQWGNFLSGIDLCKKQGANSFNDVGAFSTPLLVDSNGKKLGKTEKEPIFIDPKLTSSYTMYQWVFNLEDKFLKLFFKTLTDIELEKIDSIISTHRENRKDRLAHRDLAKYLIKTLRSEKDYYDAKRISEIMFNSDYYSLSESDLKQLDKNTEPFSNEANNKLLVNLVSEVIGDSVSNTRRLMMSNSISINNVKVSPEDSINDIKPITSKENECFYFVKKGKRNIFVLKIKN